MCVFEHLHVQSNAAAAGLCTQPLCVYVCVCVCARLFMLNQYNMQELFPLLVRLMLHLSIRGRHAIQ